VCFLDFVGSAAKENDLCFVQHHGVPVSPSGACVDNTYIKRRSRHERWRHEGKPRSRLARSSSRNQN
jgi:hypothetical protein